VGAIIAVLLLSFVLVVHSHNLFKKKTDVLVAVIQEADKAFAKSFAKDLGTEKQIFPITELGIETTLQKESWGLLQLQKVHSKKGKFQFKKMAFVGPTDSKRPALYLKDNQRPLVLVGNTKVSGTAYLPERGVKMGNIYGNSYYAPKLIYGQELQSGEQLPPLSREFQEQLLLKNFESESIDYKARMTLKNSFANPTKSIRGDYIQLEEVTLSGNIVVQATHKIVVEASSILHDIILIAPIIEIRNWTKGNFQALAQKTIKVGKGCKLDYPSVLAVNLIRKDSLINQSMEPHIALDSYAELRGFILFKEDHEEPNLYKPHVHIDENAQVHGEVYSSQNLELKGKVHGNVTVGGFVALENGNIYQNHLYNGKINSGTLAEQYAGIAYENQKTDQIIKWLY
jgi:hypothetical protein